MRPHFANASESRCTSSQLRARCAPLPPAGRGRGWGSTRAAVGERSNPLYSTNKRSLISIEFRAPPPPTPPRKGGGERTEIAATSRFNTYIRNTGRFDKSRFAPSPLNSALAFGPADNN